MRRTTIVDMLRPEGLTGPLVVAGTGRDLATGIDGEPYLVDAAATSVTVAAGPDRTVAAGVGDSAPPQPAAAERRAPRGGGPLPQAGVIDSPEVDVPPRHRGSLIRGSVP